MRPPVCIRRSIDPVILFNRYPSVFLAVELFISTYKETESFAAVDILGGNTCLWSLEIIVLIDYDQSHRQNSLYTRHNPCDGFLFIGSGDGIEYDLPPLWQEQTIQKLPNFVTIYATSVFSKQNWSQIMSRSTANVSFYCRESKKNKDGLAPLRWSLSWIQGGVLSNFQGKNTRRNSEHRQVGRKGQTW